MIDILFIFIICLTFFWQKDIFINLQTIFILCFFNLPNFYSNNIDSDYRRDVFYLGDISFHENLLFNTIILLYIIIVFISQRTIKLNIPVRQFYNQKIKYFYFYFFIILFFVFSFNISKIGAILEEGYAAYHLNELSVKSSFFIIILDLILKFLFFKGIADKKKYVDFFYFVYHILLILTGLRFSGFIGIIIWFLIKKHTYLNSNKIKIICLSIGAPYIAILTQRIRTFSELNNIEDIYILDSVFKELIVQFNFTAETLRAVIRGPIDYDINIFYGFTQFVLAIYNKVIGSSLSIDQRADLGAFAFAQAKSLRPDLFELGVTLGNSVFSETYAVLGIVGIIVIAIVHSYFFKFLFELRQKSNQIMLIWITHYFIAIPLLKAMRSSSIDWILNSLIFCLIFYIFSKLKLNILKTEIK